jgi:hypothetical protein
MRANMTIDLTDLGEPKLSVSQAARYFAPSRGGKPAHKSRVIRYITAGVVGPNGDRVYLEALRQGNQWVTTPSAIQEFAESLTPARVATPPTTRTTAVRRKAAELAGRELERHGV